MRIKKILNRFFIVAGSLSIILFFLAIYAYNRIQISEPEISNKAVFKLQVSEINDSIRICEKDWLKHDKSGLYEMFVSGSPIELGVKNGLLAKNLIAYQEKVFVDEIKKRIPSEFYLNFLKYFIGWFNRDMLDYIPVDNQKEIYGISQFTDDKFDFIAPKYQRILNYHGAHDIGHALQNMNLVACTAFALWNEKSSDGNIIIGRNFDFFVSDDFAKNKIVAFYKPDKGWPFMFITWGGLTGVVSGMNKAGLTITLNSAKSDVPTTAYTPVSLVARNILQYCSTIDEAYSMAQKFKTFVSESFLIASAKENRAAIIEKSPDTTALFEVAKSEIIATNHFQSATFKNNPLNIENIKESASMYRMQRMQELVNKKDSLNELDVAAILRDQKGLKNRNIGLCNEKAVNQLIAHHSIIFKPQKMQVWVSTYPFQLGKYICYDLNKAFSDSVNYKSIIHIDSLTIPEDEFLQTQEYKKSQFYRKGVEKINLSIKNNQELKETYLQDFINSNPQFFHVYKTVGDYYASRNEKLKAIKIYEKAFDCEFPRRIDQTDIENRISALKEQ